MKSEKTDAIATDKNTTFTGTSIKDDYEKKYVNEEYGFNFTYTGTGTIETRTDLNYQYIRLNNIHPKEDERSWLTDWEFYVEIFIFDRQKNHASSESCKEQIVDGKNVTLGIMTGYRWYGREGGDAGWKRFALCIENTNVQFYVQVTENSEQGLIANKILDSFTFKETE